jgi:membrane protein YdbS with pleckstrin-like domain
MTESVDPTPLPPPVPPTPEVAAATAPVAEAPAAVAIDDDTGWRPLPPGARNVHMLFAAMVGAILCLPPWLLGVLRLDFGLGLKIALLVVGMLVLSAYGAWIAYRRWASTAWRLDARGLHVRRGRMFQREVLVPRSRVQHLDLERGPIERHYGLATIVVHTAGTRLQALRQSGLAEADAVALRDALVPDADVDDDAV